ncbi:MAG: ADP-ribosylglycohydrolase family protein [Nitrososphaerota archaeon]|nr:ADP-ribosylglycohydrolase family protein [Candidatus Calditenuaceae archaeon]MDW8073486.1 ADP-ribosylglycohydrolase family protein [Nitrososphaerota archaeon]
MSRCVVGPEFLELLEHEFVQLDEEGRELEGLLRSEVFKRIAEGGFRAAEEVFSELRLLPMRRGYPYREPTELGEIKSCSRGWRRAEPQHPETVRDKVLGGFYGRCAGNMLGKPVEGLGIRGGWRAISERLSRLCIGKFEEYLPAAFFTEEELQHVHILRATAGNIDRALRDDDIDYTLINLRMVEKRGGDFTSIDVGREWLESLPYAGVYTAERAAYRNLVNCLTPPETALHMNPYREWIGAQIRADLWGYICPGDPSRAAELAHRDATLSHVKNGVYGEMMVAAMIAWAFVEEDVERIVEAGLSVIPAESRLREAVESVLDAWRRGVGWEEAVNLMESRLNRYHPVHTIPNAAIVAASLLWGEGDYTRSITRAVSCGLDTDCNGATVGSIVGVMKGYAGLGDQVRKKWFEPLNNRLESYIPSLSGLKITEAAERIYAAASRLGMP